MKGLTIGEADKMYDITQRLANISSPVLRLQAILQISQTVDMLAIGDTSSPREKELVNENDKLLEKINKLKRKKK
ncbi:MAG: hypothetical protein FWC41_12755 [Firmicutes bacterium]|nr:hypothetical protein [Bacillota bacterium]